jgi:four helix bundle protein
MKILRFEDLIAWQKSQDLAVYIYNEFNQLNDFGFRDQIRRATISISNNIAEGFDRRSKPDFARFLLIALASCSEVRSMLYLAVRLNYISPEKQSALMQQTFEISRIITGLIKVLKNK